MLNAITSLSAKANGLFANKKITVAEWQLDLAAVVYIVLGVGLGAILVLAGGIGRTAASASASVTKDTDTNFSQGTLSGTQVTGSGSAAVVKLTAGSTAGDSWYNSSWLYRKKITFTNAAQAENLTNFPVMVNLTSSNFDFNKALTNGEDIRFADSNGTTLLSYEIELWNKAGQQAVVWVKVPQIDASSNTDYIYAYYGNSGASDAQSASAVWSNGYVAVWHMNNTPGGSNLLDSTGNGHSGTFTNMAAGALVDGKIGKAIAFDGINDYVSLSNTGFSINTGFLQTWAKKDVAATAFGSWFNPQNCDMEIGSYNNIFQVWTSGCSAGAFIAEVTLADSTAWNYYGFEGRTDGNKMYANGVLGSPSYTSGSASTPIFLDDGTNSSNPIYIGTVTPSNEPWKGMIDEERVSNVVRTAAWIAADYLSTNNAYTTLSSEQGFAGGNGTWESATNGNVIDTVWNVGWGDGTGGSTAFSAVISNVGVNSTIVFQMRTAASTVALASATYQTLGTANSGTTFTRTKTQLDGLGLATGTSRYVQVKATLNNSDGATVPQLDSFTISYLRDNTGPETNATSLQMLKVAAGASITSNGWTNNLAPYFSWTAAADSESGVAGYCLYLGTDTNGDPTATKGLLGTSPVSIVGTPCQFIVSSTNIDFATLSLRGSTWLSTNNSPYYLNIKALDVSGNASSASAQFQFRFDSSAPTNPTFISLPGGFISTKNANITWPTTGGDAASDANSGIQGLQYRIGAAGTWYGQNHNGAQDETDLLANDGQYTTDVTADYPNLNEGSNIIYVRTWDTAGNVSAIYVSGALKINTIAPSTPQNLLATPTDNTVNSYAFNWNSPDTFTGQVGNITYCYSVNVLPSALTCNFTSAGVTSLSADAYATQPGTNTMYLVARDEASNINYETYTSTTFSYSGTAPGIAQDVEVSDISVKLTSTWKLVVSWDAPTSIGAGIKEYQVLRSTTDTSCSTNIGAFSQIGTTAGKSYTDNGLTQQNYYYCVRVCDSANNCSAVSNTKSGFPSGKFTEPAALTSGPVITEITSRKAKISWTTERDSDSKVSFGISTLNYLPEEPSKSDQTTDHQINLTNLKPGTTYFFKAKWTDINGNTGLSDEKVFQTRPAPTIRSSTVGNLGITSALVQFTSVEASKVKIYYGTSVSFGGVSEIATAILSTSYTVPLSSLSDNTKYYYKINPFDSEGNEYEGTVLDFTTLPRPRISTVRIQEVKGEAQPTVEVSWSSNTEVSSIVSYNPVGKVSEKREGVDTRYLTGEHSLVIRGLEANSQYELTVKGRDKYGNEGSSESQKFNTGVDTRPPRIFNVKVEGAIVNGGNTVNDKPTAQLIISWDTDEPGTSQIEYDQGTGVEYTQSTQRDNSLTYNHLVIISKLEASKVYHLRVVSRDDVGNEGKSVDSVTITPKASESALEIVVKNLRDIFSFL